MERKCTDKWYLEKSVAELKNLDPESCPGSLPADYNTGTSRTTQNFKCFQKVISIPTTILGRLSYLQNEIYFICKVRHCLLPQKTTTKLRKINSGHPGRILRRKEFRQVNMTDKTYSDGKTVEFSQTLFLHLL